VQPFHSRKTKDEKAQGMSEYGFRPRRVSAGDMGTPDGELGKVLRDYSLRS
jgi:hypothetical protein